MIVKPQLVRDAVREFVMTHNVDAIIQAWTEDKGTIELLKKTVAAEHEKKRK